MNFFRLQNNRKGFTLAEIMVGAGIMGILAVVLLQISRDQAKTQVKTEIDNALAQVQTEITALITNPSHCNANFANLTTSATKIQYPIRAPSTVSPSLKYCDNTTLAGACRTAGVGNVLVKFPEYHSPTWLPPLDWDPITTKISNRLRIADIEYEVPPGPNIVQGTGTGQGDGTLQPLKLTITFQFRELLNKTTNQSVRAITKTFNTVVVVDDNLVRGCPKAANSTVLY